MTYLFDDYPTLLLGVPIDCASAAAQSLHTNIFKLLAGQTFAGEHVCKCLRVCWCLLY